jgi:hypothetical protein
MPVLGMRLSAEMSAAGSIASASIVDSIRAETGRLDARFAPRPSANGSIVATVTALCARPDRRVVRDAGRSFERLLPRLGMLLTRSAKIHKVHRSRANS